MQGNFQLAKEYHNLFKKLNKGEDYYYGMTSDIAEERQLWDLNSDVAEMIRNHEIESQIIPSSSNNSLEDA